MNARKKKCKCGAALPRAAELATGLEHGVAQARAERDGKEGVHYAFGALSARAEITAAALRGQCFGCWYDALRKREAEAKSQ